jgi:hypothetical protein
MRTPAALAEIVWIVFTAVGLAASGAKGESPASGSEVVVVRDEQARAAIVTAAKPSLNARIAAAEGSVMLTPNELRVSQDRRDCYWVYVVTHCNTTPRPREPISDPARYPWHDVSKVAHYYLSLREMPP